jgi:hypothetical protein
VTGAERLELLGDLRRQLDGSLSKRARERTERAIRRIELELAGGRGVAGKAATR